jgi:hypothetical protein
MSEYIVTAMSDLYGNVSFGGRGGGGGGGKRSAARSVTCSVLGFFSGAVVGATVGAVTKNPWYSGGAGAAVGGLVTDMCNGEVKDWSSDR